MAHQHNEHGELQTETFHLEGYSCVCCVEAVEHTLRANPHIEAIQVDYKNDLVRVSYHSGMITASEIERLIAQAGVACRAAERSHGDHKIEHEAGTSSPQMPGRTMQRELEQHASHGTEDAAGGMLHLEHRAQLAPITMGTKMDRMQYELPATGAHAMHDPAHDHTAATNNVMQHMEGSEGHGGHGGMDHDMSDPRMAKAMEADMQRRFWIALLLTIPALLYSPVGMNLLGVRLPAPIPVNWILFLLATPVVFYCGWIFLSGAYYSLRHHALNMSVLVATGVLAAYIFSVFLTIFASGETFYEAAAMLVTFVLFGHWMEMRARRGTTDALRALFDLVPPTATLMRDGRQVELPTSDIVVGDIVVLRPGDKVPVDGAILSGQTSIDESLVTGESLPVSKGLGDPVIGGSINRSGTVTFEATKVGADTTLAQIVRLVEEAQSSKAPGQRLADTAAQYLVILAVGSGIATFLAWYFLGQTPAIVALTFAISAVVIACPDALGLATPTAVAVATGLGARHNVLIKDAATLEGIARINTVVMDKTGTLTEGKPQLTDLVLAEPNPQLDTRSLLRLVGSAEQRSEHPLAHALIEGARAEGIALSEPEQFEALSGRGLRATIDGRTVLIGNRKLMDDYGIASGDIAGRVDGLAAAGKTAMFVAVDGAIAGAVAVADTVKPTARQTIAELQRRGIEVVMMSGDNTRTANAVAKQLNLNSVFAEVLPQEKAGYVKQLQREGKVVAMVGDGVNDAPALAQADIGIAIGAGTDVAIETARVVLMKADPLDIVRALQIAQATVTKMKQNLFWASIYNILAIPLAAGVLYPSLGIMLRPEWSALLMSLSSIIVAVNAVLLKRVEGHLVVSRPQPNSAIQPVRAF